MNDLATLTLNMFIYDDLNLIENDTLNFFLNIAKRVNQSGGQSTNNVNLANHFELQGCQFINFLTQRQFHS